jgi:hypothetical protein
MLPGWDGFTAFAVLGCAKTSNLLDETIRVANHQSMSDKEAANDVSGSY